MLDAPRQTSTLHVHEGVVSGIDGTSVYVRIPYLSATGRFGPCRMLETVVTPGETTAPGGAPTHTHPVIPVSLALGDEVLVAFVNGSRNQPRILGRLLP